FSSRRRHTRSDRDWSSDVCSSDLLSLPRVFEQGACGGDRRLQVLAAVAGEARRAELLEEDLPSGLEIEMPFGEPGHSEAVENREIGRASCRERVEMAVGAGALQKA